MMLLIFILLIIIIVTRVYTGGIIITRIFKSVFLIMLILVTRVFTSVLLIMLIVLISVLILRMHLTSSILILILVTIVAQPCDLIPHVIFLTHDMNMILLIHIIKTTVAECLTIKFTIAEYQIIKIHEAQVLITVIMFIIRMIRALIFMMPMVHESCNSITRPILAAVLAKPQVSITTQIHVLFISDDIISMVTLIMVLLLEPPHVFMEVVRMDKHVNSSSNIERIMAQRTLHANTRCPVLNATFMEHKLTTT